MRLWAFFLLIFGQTFSIASQAQTPAAEKSVYRVDVHVVLVDAQVLNKKTRQAARELKKEDFELYEDNVRQQVSSFSQDTLPLSVVLLFDLTDSVRPVLKSLADGALEALQHLKPEDEVSGDGLCGVGASSAGSHYGSWAGGSGNRKGQPHGEWRSCVFQ